MTEGEVVRLGEGGGHLINAVAVVVPQVDRDVPQGAERPPGPGGIPVGRGGGASSVPPQGLNEAPGGGYQPLAAKISRGRLRVFRIGI